MSPEIGKGYPWLFFANFHLPVVHRNLLLGAKALLLSVCGHTYVCFALCFGVFSLVPKLLGSPLPFLAE